MSWFAAQVFKSLLAPSPSRVPVTRKPSRASCKPLLEFLEDRTAPAVFAPTTFADGTDPGTLRNAILQANSNNADNTITLASGTYTLSPAAGGELALTGVNHALTIQGTGPTNINPAGAGSGQASTAGQGGGGAQGGGLYLAGGSLSITASTIANNSAVGGNGGPGGHGGARNVAATTIVPLVTTGPFFPFGPFLSTGPF